MPSITIRNLDARLKARLRIRAAEHGRSMEEEVREILRTILSEHRSVADLAEAIHVRFAPLGGVDLPSIDRGPLREPPSFDS